MKKLLQLFSVSVLLLTVAGCGKSETGTSDNANSNELTVYSSHPSDLLTPIVNNFISDMGIKVNLVTAGTGELLKRIQSEDGSPLGDVMLGGGAESLDAYKEYFQEYKSINNDMIDSKLRDPENKWTGFSSLPIVIIYNKKMVPTKDIPERWSDLLDKKWFGKLALASPIKSGSSYTALVTILSAYGKDSDKAWDIVKALEKNLDGKILQSSSAVPKGVVGKEYPIGITLEKYYTKYNVNGDLGAVYPLEGTSAVPDGVAIIKNSANMENSKIFLDYVTGLKIQNMLADDFGFRPVRNDANTPKNLLPLKDIKLVDYDFSWASSDKNKITRRWKNIVSGKET